MTRNSPGHSPAWYLLNGLVPALFALLVMATIRFHSLMLVPTMPRMVGNLLALDAIALLGLLALGRRIAVPRDIAMLSLALAGSATISVLGSGDADTSLLRLELYLAITWLAGAFYVLYRDTDQVPLEGFFLAVSLAYLPFLFAAVLWIADLTPPFWQDSVRVADFQHVRQFGEFSFFAAASATALGVISRRMAWPALLLSAVALFGIILTGCRGALLSWMLFAALSWGFCRGRLKAGMLVSGSLAIPALLVWYLDQSGVLQSPNVFNRVAQVVQADGAGFDSGRIQMWIEALRQIAAHPLFGSGPEGYWLSGCCNRGAMQAHNFVLQFLMEFGAAGCAIVALLMFRVMRHLGGLAAIRSLVLANEGNKVLASMILAYLAYSLIDQTMYHLLPLLLIAPVAGLLAAGLAQARAAATMSV